MRYYVINDKRFREQRDRKTIQAGIITKTAEDDTADCSAKA